jgi:hypothetical protein
MNSRLFSIGSKQYGTFRVIYRRPVKVMCRPMMWEVEHEWLGNDFKETKSVDVDWFRMAQGRACLIHFWLQCKNKCWGPAHAQS